MTCRCTVNTLTVFIRNVAQVDVPSSSRHATHPVQKYAPQHASSRGFAGSFLSRRSYSSAISNEVNEKQLRLEMPIESPIAEISLDAIDAILAESPWTSSAKQDTGAESNSFGYETPLQSLLEDMPQRKARGAWTGRRGEDAKPFTLGDTPKPLIRRTTRNAAFPDDPQALGQASRVEKAMKSSRSKQRPGDDWVPPPREPWMNERNVAKEKYPEGYKPLKKLSPDAIAGIRALHAQMPERYTTWALSQEFKVSPEAIRRILKSKWRPDAEEETDRQKRWFKRGESIWGRYAELGLKPPKKWRELGIGNGKPEWMLRKQVEQYQPLPALVTTARRKEFKSGNQNEAKLADRIL
ncbi:hypothetical protein WAI453_005795 [Rhynchosporium graminicola]|uniref:Required for respiratory growth protein 9, mitochondrial n=1 Tax=Rhynchosporium graminicola TaxID=2792576 RepID=A0A1E1KKB6_9HELO|nr:uncharacterized protein RCO7_04176 [Rhynchosporium commune]